MRRTRFCQYQASSGTFSFLSMDLENEAKKNPTFRLKSKLSAHDGGILAGEQVITDSAPVVDKADLQSTFVARASVDQSNVSIFTCIEWIWI